MTKYYKETKLEYPKTISKNTEDKIFGNGWAASKDHNNFYFLYVSGQLAGKKNRIEIDEEDFLALKSGNIGFDQICRKYGAD